jgi:hypothetical protein
LNRPFSAAVPLVRGITQGKKKTVMFEDELKEETEFDIINDDDANDNDYVQFNQSPKMNTPPMIINKNLPPKAPNLRPVTAIPVKNSRAFTA